MKTIVTDEQIRIAMAEVRGLFRIEPLRRTNKQGYVMPDGERLRYRDESGYYEEVPDWPNDLNAVHAFENYAYDNLMDSDQWENYGRLLERTHPQATILTKDKVDYHEFAHLCHIPARRRCECLLVAMKKS